LFVDDVVGGAVGTGRGELITQICGSHLVVESMRAGLKPQAACKHAVLRILELRERGAVSKPHGKTFQAGFIAVNTLGEWGAASIQPGFTVAVHDERSADRMESSSLIAEVVDA
jgi:N4-(beta-N-acetylglucosaminyl)-L-asparaginase